MPSLDTHKPQAFTKLLLIGESKSGKTGSLTSLVKAGYSLRILDMDNGVDVLRLMVLKDCPDKIKTVEVKSLRDDYVSSPMGPIIRGTPQAFVGALRLLDKWEYEEDGQKVALGDPATWGDKTILVIDSLTLLSEAAFAWALQMVPRGKDGKFDNRAVYGEAQKAIRSVLSLLTSPSFCTNVIVTAHVRYINLPDSTMKGFPTAIGEALSPEIPRYFNSTLRFETMPGGKRTIHTVASALMDLGNPAPFKVPPTLPIETGLADFFKAVRS